jgi:hypothetical protein
MTKFNRSPETNPYTIITPDTPLTELESFLMNHIFALSTYLLLFCVSCFFCFVLGRMTEYLVTDYERKFVLGVATSQDLEVDFVRVGDYPPLTRARFLIGIRLTAWHLVSFASGLYHHFCWSARCPISCII